MWRNLLAERFKLTVHREMKEMLVCELAVAKGGLRVKESVEESPATRAAAEAPPPPPDGPPKLHLDKDGFPEAPAGCGFTVFANGKTRMRACEETMEHLASTLESPVSRPVTDATGLKGKYDFTLWWSPCADPSDSGTGPAIFGALQSQLGLKLDMTRSSSGSRRGAIGRSLSPPPPRGTPRNRSAPRPRARNSRGWSPRLRPPGSGGSRRPRSPTAPRRGA